jgi:hypothetical protein
MVSQLRLEKDNVVTRRNDHDEGIGRDRLSVRLEESS